MTDIKPELIEKACEAYRRPNRMLTNDSATRHHDCMAAALEAVADDLRAEGGWSATSIPHTVSDRGLAYPEPILTEYGELVSAYDSSAATQDCIWLGIRGERDTDGGWDEWHVHLTFAQAEQLITQMQWLMDRRADS